MRGKVPDIPPTHDENRITPAYAGKRQGSYFKVAVIEDHPRLCGEKFLLFSFEQFRTGSPPPMRGKVLLDVLRASTHRITPAYAGKRPLYFCIVGIKRDHPRLCGEKKMPVFVEPSAERITPAYAGKSVSICTSHLPS